MSNTKAAQSDEKASTDKRRKSKYDEFKDGFDPVKMYLRRIGKVNLLTREGEVEIAKEIEAGRQAIFDVIVDNRAGIEMILAVPDRLKAGTARAREVFDEYEPSAEESSMPVAVEVFKRFEKVKRVQKKLLKIQDDLAALEDDTQNESRADLEKSYTRSKKKMVKSVLECSLSQRFINELVANYKEGLQNIDRCYLRVYHSAMDAGIDSATARGLCEEFKLGGLPDLSRFGDPVTNIGLRDLEQTIRASRAVVDAIQPRLLYGNQRASRHRQGDHARRATGRGR